MVFRTVLVFLLLQAPLLQTVRTNRSRSPIIQRRYRQSIGPLEPGNPLKNDVQGDSGPVLTSTLSSMTGDSGAQRASDALIYWNGLEPDATTICSQLVDVLTGPYYHSHGPFLAEMAEQVQDNIIGPDLRKSLLMIFVQHHREQLRRLYGEGLTLQSVPSSPAYVCQCTHMPCTDQEPPNRVRNDQRYLRWRTSRWKRVLARQTVRRRCRRRRCFRSSDSAKHVRKPASSCDLLLSCTSSALLWMCVVCLWHCISTPVARALPLQPARTLQHTEDCAASLSSFNWTSDRAPGALKLCSSSWICWLLVGCSMAVLHAAITWSQLARLIAWSYIACNGISTLESSLTGFFLEAADLGSVRRSLVHDTWCSCQGSGARSQSSLCAGIGLSNYTDKRGHILGLLFTTCHCRVIPRMCQHKFARVLLSSVYMSISFEWTNLPILLTTIQMMVHTWTLMLTATLKEKSRTLFPDGPHSLALWPIQPFDSGPFSTAPSSSSRAIPKAPTFKGSSSTCFCGTQAGTVLLSYHQSP